MLAEKGLIKSDGDKHNSENKGKSSYRLVQEEWNGRQRSNGSLYSILSMTDGSKRKGEQADVIFPHSYNPPNSLHLYKTIMQTFASMFLI